MWIIHNCSEEQLQSVEEEIRKRRTALFLLKPKFLSQDVREEMISNLIEVEIDANGQYDYDDRSETSDQEVLDEYSDYVDGDEENELLQRGLADQVEHKMLSQSTVG